MYLQVHPMAEPDETTFIRLSCIEEYWEGMVEEAQGYEVHYRTDQGLYFKVFALEETRRKHMAELANGLTPSSTISLADVIR